ncbi:MAG: type II toxin-antitoxin system HicA family toxin [Kovacikia sp.]
MRSALAITTSLPKEFAEENSCKDYAQKTGFSEHLGKGSHTKWLHPLYPGRVTLSGKDGNDAKPYQEFVRLT